MQSKVETYKTILRMLDAGIVNPAAQQHGCMYEDADGIMCGVGCLLSWEQIQHLDEMDMQSTRIGTVLDELANVGLPIQVGLSYEELYELQNQHDAARCFAQRGEQDNSFRKYVQSSLDACQDAEDRQALEAINNPNTDEGMP